MAGFARLSFDFYRSLAELLDTHTIRFELLARDYAREVRGELLCFAVDFSELHDYLHRAAPHAHRGPVNTYILDTLQDSFTMLPGAVAELLTDLATYVPSRLHAQLDQILARFPAVAEFRDGFPDALQHDDRLLQLYAAAQTSLTSALGLLVDALLAGVQHTAVFRLRHLLDQKLRPVDGLQDITSFSSEHRYIRTLVESHLGLSRPQATANNQIDALDFTIAFYLNERPPQDVQRYIALYSQSRALLLACRSHARLKWQEDYLIRDAKYLQYRARLQDLLPDAATRYARVKEWAALCGRALSEIRTLIDFETATADTAAAPSAELLDLYRRFEEECLAPLALVSSDQDVTPTRERAVALYSLLKDTGRYSGQITETVAVLKEHLTSIEKTLGLFLPSHLDPRELGVLKRRLRNWLGVDPLR